MSYFHRVSAQTKTRFWINNVTWEEANLALENGATGCTQNPSYTYKMLVHPKNSAHAVELMHQLVKEIEDDNDVEVALQRMLVSEAAKAFLPLYEASNGQDGYVSIQGDPFDESYETIMKLAHYNREAGPNIMIKIPATADGIRAIEQCIRENIPVNCTEVFAMQQDAAGFDAAGAAQQLQDGQAGNGFAAAAFTNDADGLALFNLKAYAAHGLHFSRRGQERRF